MATGARKTKKLPLNAVSPSPPLSRTCYLIVPCRSAGVNSGQAIIQVGLLWIPHSIGAGLFLGPVFARLVTVCRFDALCNMSGWGGCGVKFLHIERKITSVVHSHPPSHYIRTHALGC